MTLAANIAALPNGDDAPVYACRAWVNFDGAHNFSGDNPSTSAIRDSGNVSSILEKGNGWYKANFAANMPDTNYAVVGSSISTTGSIDTSKIVAVQVISYV